MTRSAGLRRAFPQSYRQLRLVGAAVPDMISLIWAALIGASLPAEPNPRWLSAADVAVIVTAGVVRSATRPSLRYDAPLVDTPMGAFPPALIGQLVRGPDFVIFGALPLALGAPATVAMGIPLALLLWALLKDPRGSTLGIERGTPG